MADHTDYQRKVIKRYYDNREGIDAGRLSELVTNLYLAETAKQREKLWKKAEETMTRLEVPPSRLKHVMESQDAAVLAEVVVDLQAGKI